MASVVCADGVEVFGGVQPALRVLVAVWARNEPVKIRAVLGVLMGQRGSDVAADLGTPKTRPAAWADEFLSDLAKAGDAVGLDAAECRALLFSVPAKDPPAVVAAAAE